MNNFAVIDLSHYMWKTYSTAIKNNMHITYTEEDVAVHCAMIIKQQINSVSSNIGAVDAKIWCMDSTGSEARRNILPDYKKKENKDPEEERRRRNIFNLIQNEIKEDCSSDQDMVFFQIPGYEADDLIWCVCKVLFPSDKKVILTFDSDLWQLIDTKTSVFSEKKGQSKIINLENFHTESETSESPAYKNPQAYLLGKILCGDNSDNIPGIPGIGKITANGLVSKYGNLENIIKRRALFPDMKIRSEEKILESLSNPQNIQIIRRNIQLIDISKVANNLHLRQMMMEFYNQQID